MIQFSLTPPRPPSSPHFSLHPDCPLERRRHPQHVQRAWWNNLQSLLRQLPRKYQPFLLLDANARLTPGSSGCIAEEHCANVPARLMQHLLQTQQLCASGKADSLGRTLVSWQSPTGHSACLDYLLIPQVFACGFRVLGNIDGFSDRYDFDHRPLLFHCVWTSVGCGSNRAVRLDRRAMMRDGQFFTTFGAVLQRPNGMHMLTHTSTE